MGLAAVWCLEVYLAGDWAEIRWTTLGLAIFAIAEFLVWLVNLPGYNPGRENIAAVGIGFGVFMILLIYYFIIQERAAKKQMRSQTPME